MLEEPLLKEKIKCPICNGTGEIEYRIRGDFSQLVKKLIDSGLSYRTVMNFMGWKSPRSVQYWYNIGAENE
jgi:sarcosine oxidase delta subunit